MPLNLVGPDLIPAVTEPERVSAEMPVTATEPVKKRNARKPKVTPTPYPITREFKNPLFKHSVLVPRQLLWRKDLSFAAAAMYGILRSYETTREAYPPVERLARDLGVGRTTISKLIGELERHGLIKVTRRGSQHRPNLFQFTDHPWLHEPRPNPARPPIRGQWRRGSRPPDADTHGRVSESPDTHEGVPDSTNTTESCTPLGPCPTPDKTSGVTTDTLSGVAVPDSTNATESCTTRRAEPCTTPSCGKLHDDRVVHVGVVHPSRSTSERDPCLSASRQAAFRPSTVRPETKPSDNGTTDRPTDPTPSSAAPLPTALDGDAHTHPVAIAWANAMTAIFFTDPRSRHLLSDEDVKRLLASFEGDIAVTTKYVEWVLSSDVLDRLRHEGTSVKAKLSPHWRPSVAWVCGLVRGSTSYRAEFMGAVEVARLTCKWVGTDRIEVANFIYPVIDALHFHTKRRHGWPESVARALHDALSALHLEGGVEPRLMSAFLCTHLPKSVAPAEVVKFYVEIARLLDDGEDLEEAARLAAERATSGAAYNGVAS